MISSTFNPAAGLTANKVPYALGGGRLGNSGITFDPSANGNTTIVPNGTGTVDLFKSNSNSVLNLLRLVSHPSAGNAGGSGIIFAGVNDPSRPAGKVGIFYQRTGGEAIGDLYIALNSVVDSNPVTTADAKMIFLSGGTVLCGSTSNSGNGRFQLASHSALSGGYAFGTAADGTETIWRHASGVLRTGGTLRADVGLDVNGVTRINTTRPAWTGVTGGPSGTRNLQEIAAGTTAAQVLAALDYLVRDLISIGILSP